MRLFDRARIVIMRWQRRRARPLSLEDRNIRYFFADTACQGLIGGGIGTFISVFIVRLGASSLLVSLLTSLPAIVVSLLSMPAGLFVERQRNMMRIANGGRFFLRGCYLLVALIPFFVSHRLAEAIVVICTLQAIPSALINPAWMAVIAEIVPPQRRPSVNGGRWALVSLVTAVAVAIFGYLLERLAFPINYQIVFAISFLGGMLSIYFFSRIKPPEALPTPPVPEKAVTLGQRLRGYVKSFAETPVFLRYLFTTCVLRFGLTLPAALYSIYWVRHLNASDVWIGWQATAGSLALAVGYYLWGKIAGRKGHHRVLVACTVGAGFYPMLMAFVPAEVWLPLVALVRGFFTTGIDISFFDTLLHVCPAEKRPSFIALNTVFANLAVFLAPMTGSLLADWLDIRAIFFIAGGIHLLAALLFRLFHIGVD